MKNYIGIKTVQARPMTKYEFFLEKTGEKNVAVENEEGYFVQYTDGYQSWSPKAVFEKSYMEVDPNPKLKTDISVSQRMVDNFIAEKHVQTLGEKTTLVRVVLVNGFEIVEASACVDPANYDEAMGAEICMDRIKSKIWSYLGFLLQTAVGGVK